MANGDRKISTNPSLPAGFGADQSGRIVKLPEPTPAPAPKTATEQLIDSTQSEFDLATTPQRKIDPSTLPTGIVDRGGQSFTVDPATGNLVPLGESFREGMLRRRVGEESAERRKLFGVQVYSELEEAKEREARRLEGDISRTGAEKGELKGLGFSSAELGVIASIEDRSDRRIKDLERSAKKAIAQFNMEEFNRAQSQIDRELDRQQKREDTLFNRLLALKGEARAERKEAKTEAEELVDDVVKSEIPNLPSDPVAREDVLRDIAKRNNLSFDDVRARANELQFERDQELFDMAQDITEGEVKTLSDGTVVHGMKPKDPKISQFQVTDSSGKWVVALDKVTGKQLYKVKLGEADPPETDEESIDRENLTLDIEAIRGGDGKLDTGKYAEIRAAIDDPKLLDYLDKKYPVKANLNPDDPTAERFFTTAGGTTPGLTPEADIAELKRQGLTRKEAEDDLKVDFPNGIPSDYKRALDDTYGKSGFFDFLNLEDRVID